MKQEDIKSEIPTEMPENELRRWAYQRYIKDYLRVVASVDDNVGRILDYLDDAGLVDDTLVIYTSDQGFFLGDHGWYDKRFMYEESLRIPLMVRYPREVEPGSVDGHIVSNVDLAPTFLALAGLPTPRDMHGRSIVPLLQGQAPADWRQSFYYHFYEFPAVHSVRRHYGVRTDRYKLIHYYRLGEWELFDLQKDPRELRNVYNEPAYRPVVSKLNAELQRLRRELRVPEDTKPRPRRG